MKQTIQLAGMVVLFIFILGLSYFLYQHNQQSNLALEQLQQNHTKQIADLNDRLVAVARQHSDPATASHAINLSASNVASQQQVIGQQQQQFRTLQQQWTLTALQLAQQQLNASDYRRAQELLLQLQQNVAADYRVQQSPLQATLLQTLKIDQLSIRQNETRQQQLQEQTDRSLSQLQQQLNNLAVHTTTAWSAENQPMLSTPWWKRLLIIERINPDMAQQQLDRNFIYKQASLNIAMARLALMQHNPLDFNRYLTEATAQLKLLTDVNSRQILQRLNKLANQPLAERIQLTSLTLLAGAKPSNPKRAP